MIKLCFVCTGNTCRSPMAQYLFNKKAKTMSLPFKATSAGLTAFSGDEANPNAVAVMCEIGVDISAHRAKRLTSYDADECDLIVCMTKTHALYLESLPKEKIIVPPNDISDPYAGNIDVYRKCRNELDTFTDHLINMLKRKYSGTVSPMAAEDIEPISEIEKECFSKPWSAESIKAELENPTAHFFTFKKDGKVCGYIGMHMVLDECYIANVAVSKNCRRSGIGQALVEKAILEAKENNCSFISLEVRKSNSAAIALYEKNGFSTVGERKNFYSDPTENALIMTKYFEGDGENQ